MKNEFLDKILKLLSVLKNGNKEVVSEYNKICEISISDTITLNFRNVENICYYIVNIISFYKSYENKQFNEIVIKDNNNEIKYNFDVNVLLVRNVSFDKIWKETNFITRLIKSVKRSNIEIRCFGYISKNFKFEFSNRDDVSIHVKNNFSEIIIKDKNIVSFSASYDIQDTVLSLFCELKDFIDIKQILRKYVSENNSKIIENKKLLLDIISWYTILGGVIEEDAYINFEGIIVNSFNVSENITLYRSNIHTPSNIKNKLYYSFEENSVTYKEKDVYQFYTPNEIIKDFEKNNNITFNKVENMEKFYEKFVKNYIVFNYRKIFQQNPLIYQLLFLV